MKYLVTLVVGVFGGFVGAWLLFTASGPSPIHITPSTVQVLPHLPLQSAGSERPRQASYQFDDISQQPTVFQQQLVAWEIAATANAKDLEHWIDICLDESDPLYRNNLAGIFLERYVELEPEGAMNYVRSEYRFDQDAMQSHVLTSWVRYDPEAALDYFRGIQDLRLRSMIGAQLLQDPVLERAGMIGEVESILGPSVTSIRKQLEIQQADPVELFDSALTMSGLEQRSRMAYAINRWVSIDPEAALDRIGSLDPGKTRSMLMQVAISRYAQRNPEGALAYVQLHDPDNNQLKAQAITIMAQQDIQKALPMAEAFDRNSGLSIINSVVSTWAQTDPVAALAYIDTLEPSKRGPLYGNIVYHYVQEYPQQSLDWITSLGPEYAQVRRAGLQIIARQNVDLATSALPHVAGESRNALIATIAEEKAKVDPEKALEWLSAYQREPAYSNALISVINRAAQSDPVRAAQLIDITNLNDRYESAVSMVAHHWYSKSPDDAIAWVQSLPAGPNRNHVLGSISTMVSNDDPDRAIELIKNLPTVDKEQAAMAMAYSWIGSRPEEIDSLIAQLNLSDNTVAELRRITENPPGPGIR